MSRIGRQPIQLPSGVSVSISPGRVMVNGPLGELSQEVPARMKVEQENGSVVVTRPSERGEDRALHGLTRSLIANMVEGVTSGFQKRLEIQGVGYRAALRGTDLELSVGFSHQVVLKAPHGWTDTHSIVLGVALKYGAGGSDDLDVGIFDAQGNLLASEFAVSAGQVVAAPNVTPGSWWRGWRPAMGARRPSQPSVER